MRAHTHTHTHNYIYKYFTHSHVCLCMHNTSDPKSNARDAMEWWSSMPSLKMRSERERETRENVSTGGRRRRRKVWSRSKRCLASSLFTRLIMIVTKNYCHCVLDCWFSCQWTNCRVTSTISNVTTIRFLKIIIRLSPFVYF